MLSWSLQFLLGLCLGTCIFYLCAFPLVYGLPRALCGYVTGEYRWGIVRRVIAGAAPRFLLCAAAIGIARGSDSILIDSLLSKQGIQFGLWVAAALGIASLFSEAVKRNFDWKSTEYIRTCCSFRPNTTASRHYDRLAAKFTPARVYLGVNLLVFLFAGRGKW